MKFSHISTLANTSHDTYMYCRAFTSVCEENIHLHLLKFYISVAHLRNYVNLSNNT